MLLQVTVMRVGNVHHAAHLGLQAFGSVVGQLGEGLGNGPSRGMGSVATGPESVRLRKIDPVQVPGEFL